ncbi:hypothetical protein K501DRAFT_279000 [Backusella circina FSU 941]|nr:hypothetical protein K501DRAFT_279000 [Backusella circina FSU 941]
MRMRVTTNIKPRKRINSPNTDWQAVISAVFISLCYAFFSFSHSLSCKAITQRNIRQQIQHQEQKDNKTAQHQGSMVYLVLWFLSLAPCWPHYFKKIWTGMLFIRSVMKESRHTSLVTFCDTHNYASCQFWLVGCNYLLKEYVIYGSVVIGTLEWSDYVYDYEGLLQLELWEILLSSEISWLGKRFGKHPGGISR